MALWRRDRQRLSIAAGEEIFAAGDANGFQRALEMPELKEALAKAEIVCQYYKGASAHDLATALANLRERTGEK